VGGGGVSGTSAHVVVFIRLRNRSFYKVSSARSFRYAAEPTLRIEYKPARFGARYPSAPMQPPEHTRTQPSSLIQRTQDTTTAAVQNVRVDHGSAHIAMAQQFLDRPNPDHPFHSFDLPAENLPIEEKQGAQSLILR
jgi:hypothetical protein